MKSLIISDDAAARQSLRFWLDRARDQGFHMELPIIVRPTADGWIFEQRIDEE